MRELLDELGELSELISGTTISGVRTIFAPSDAPLTAGLVFRVGRADETVPTSGITHLVEHLALFGHDEGDIHHNGHTYDHITQFHVSGTESEVVAYLGAVCRALSDLPLHRLEIEKDILRTEAAGQGRHPAYAHRVERHGARGPGTSAYDEMGLYALEADQVARWARDWFTAGNAVLWVAGEKLPEGLELPLPEGPLRPPAPLPAVERPRPGHFPGWDGGVLADAVVDRGIDVGVFSLLATRLLYRALRTEGGHSYVAICDFDPIDRDHARVSLLADARPEHHQATADGMIAVLDAIRSRDIDPRDVDAAKDTIRKSLEIPHVGAAMLPSTAVNLLNGHPLAHPRELGPELDAVSIADIARVADAVWEDLLLQLPEGVQAPAGIDRTLWVSSRTVEGTRYPLLNQPGTSAVVGPDGVSIVGESGAVTVLFDECAAYLTTPDGARSLVGADGFRIHLEPNTMVGFRSAALAELDARVPAHAVIPLPARAEDDIPPAIEAIPWKGVGMWALALIIPFILVLLFTIPFALAATVSPAALDLPASTLMRLWIANIVLVIATITLIVGVRLRRFLTKHGAI